VELGVEAEEVEGRNWWNWVGQEEVEAEELEKLVELGVGRKWRAEEEVENRGTDGTGE
jgi:PAS domain-containing protein